MDEKAQLLAAQMAAVSAVQSQEIVNAAATAAELNDFQRKLDKSFDRVMEVRETLSALKEHQVTPSLAAAMDTQLTMALDTVEQTIPVANGASAVEGAESLGRTLTPHHYLMTRLAGCENFLTDFFKKSKEVTAHLTAQFQDAYVIFTESRESLLKQLDIVESAVSEHRQFGSKGKLVLGSRAFNRFQINGKVDEKWVSNITKLNQTLSALSGNYYLNNKNTMGAVFSYFGGFGKLNEHDAEERLKRLPISIPTYPFKECTYPDPAHAAQHVVAKRSVEMMGGAYFYDVRSTVKPVVAKDVEEVTDWLNRVVAQEGTHFEKGGEFISKPGYEVQALSVEEIKDVIRALRKLLDDWGRIFDNGEKYLINDRDYLSTIRDFSEADFSNGTKDRLGKYYMQVIHHHQIELLKLRASGSHYVALIINAMIRFCKDSIEFGAQ